MTMHFYVETIYMYCKSNKELLESQAKGFRLLNDLSQPGARDEFAKYMIKIKVYKDIMQFIEDNQ